MAEPKILTRSQALKMARELITFYVAYLGLPDPHTLDCHECADRKAVQFGMYVYPVCRVCGREMAFVLGDIRAIARLARTKKELAAGVTIAHKLLSAPAPQRVIVTDPEYITTREE